MGAYLSKPVTEKISTDENNEILTYGASSMQGWRVYQEDAHNAVLNFDKNQSLFAVYDGHGGHEVATYTASELPKFIKKTESYDKGQISQALSDAFLEFDATLIETEVLTILKDIAGSKDQDVVQHLLKEPNWKTKENITKVADELRKQWIWCNVYPLSLRTIEMKVDKLAADFSWYSISDRAGVAVASAVLKDFGIITDDDNTNVIDRSKLRRQRCKYREQIRAEEEVFFGLVDSIYVDGRQDGTVTITELEGRHYQQTKVEEHYVIVGEPDSDYDGEEVDHLCREAAMPLEEVMAKYSEDSQQFQSPNVRSKKKVSCGPCSEEGCSSSDDGLNESFEETAETDESIEGASNKSIGNISNLLSEKKLEKNSENSLNYSSGSSPVIQEVCSATGESAPSSLCNGVPSEEECAEGERDSVSECDIVNGELKSAQINGKIKDEGGGTTKQEDRNGEEKSLSPQPQNLPAKTNLLEDGREKKEQEEEEEPKGVNGDACPLELSSSGKGKGKSKGKGILSNALVQAMRVVQRNEKKRKAAEKAEQIYKQIQGKDDDDSQSDDDDDEDEEDDNFEDECCQGYEENSSSEEGEDSDNEEDEVEDDDEEEENDLDDDHQYHEFSMNMREEPGYDSGCTACVAFLDGRDLYVANVGDSRCVVCRNGKAIDMSIDHKPEDEPEASRITKAGGRITSDGRVNGGLNLSRALGDHSYKQNKNQRAEEQMISPLPDVRSLTLTAEDSFMVIACDGIWNSLSSQEVCDFVLERLQTHNKLSTIAEEMFDHCLSPDAHGDGTGCDNMTCIIVKFHGSDAASEAVKRSCEKSEGETEDDPQEKRCRLEEAE